MERLGHTWEYNRPYEAKLENVMILDSTLREGEQAPGVYFTNRQRLQLAWMLDYFGVDMIEISPIISPEHEECYRRMVSMIRSLVHTPIDVHCHNDLGLSPANSLAGLEAGATQVHTTIDGFGERSGITPLAGLVMTLRFIYGVELNVRTEMLKELPQTLVSYTGVSVPPTKPIVGENVYKHKAGTYTAAVLRSPEAYELIPPELVGGSRRLVFSPLCGRSGAATLLELSRLEPTLEEAERAASRMKRLFRGDLFELELSRMEWFLSSEYGSSGVVSRVG